MKKLLRDHERRRIRRKAVFCDHNIQFPRLRVLRHHKIDLIQTNSSGSETCKSHLSRLPIHGDLDVCLNLGERIGRSGGSRRNRGRSGSHAYQINGERLTGLGRKAGSDQREVRMLSHQGPISKSHRSGSDGCQIDVLRQRELVADQDHSGVGLLGSKLGGNLRHKLPLC